MDLGNNSLSEIDSDSFISNKDLKELILNDNYLSTIPKITQLEKLTILNLKNQHGKLRVIPDYAFERKENNSEISIYLNDNSIKKVSSKAFCNRFSQSIAGKSIFIQMNNINLVHKCMFSQFNSQKVLISTKKRAYCYNQAYGSKYNIKFESIEPSYCSDMTIKKDLCSKRKQYIC